MGEPANAIEAAIMEWAAASRSGNPSFTRFVAAFTELGGGKFALALAALAVLWLLVRRYPGAALVLASTVLAQRALVEVLKEWIDRPRPTMDVVLPMSMAFPSGHTANGTTTFMIVALLAAPQGTRWAATVAALILSLLVGLSRIYLGVHWPTDVLGGWALGLLAVAAALIIGQRSGTAGFESKHDVVRGHLLAGSKDQSA